MPVKHTTILAGGGLTALGVAVGLALGSGAGVKTLNAQSTQPVEVRTQVVRRTVNVYRHAKPHHVAAGAGPAGRGALPTASGQSARTRSSAGTLAAAQAPASTPVAVTRSSRSSSGSSHAGTGRSSRPHTVTTRSSGSHASPKRSSSPHTVTTRSSGATGPSSGSGSSHGVTTRSSGGGHHDDGGGHDD